MYYSVYYIKYSTHLYTYKERDGERMRERERERKKKESPISHKSLNEWFHPLVPSSSCNFHLIHVNILLMSDSNDI